ncbi:MAG: S1C family serine protease, partial [Acidiferrobacterales bacterium]
MRLSLVSAALTAVALTAVAAERDVSTFSLETQATSFLGVRTADVDAATAKRLGLPVERGVLVLDVEHDGPAHEAGLRTDDVLWRFRDQALHSVAQLRRLVRETPPGRKIEIALYRAGALTRVSIVLAKDESRQEYALDIPGFRFSFPRDFPFDSFTEKNRPRLGISVVPLTGQLAKHYAARGGLLV